MKSLTNHSADSESQYTNDKKYKTLAIIPCFNESRTIQEVISKTKPHVDIVLVIDDGSSDQTATIAQKNGAIVIKHDHNMGKGAAIHTGFCYASTHDFDLVVTIDGDGQHNPDEIPHLFDPIIKGSSDISLGFRSGRRTEMPGWRKLGKRILDYATSFANGGVVTDSQCGFRAFNSKAIDAILPQLKGNGFSVESEQLIYAHDAKLTFNNVHISCKYQDLYQTSKEKPAIHGFYVLISVFFLLLKKRPLVFLGILGFLLASFGGVLVLYAVKENTALIQLTTIIQWMTGFLFFLGFCFLSIGIVFSKTKRKTRRVVC